MPQFDVFIFLSSVSYLLIGFMSLMFYNQFIFLPKLSAILKLREKIQLFQSSDLELKDLNLIKISSKLY